MANKAGLVNRTLRIGIFEPEPTSIAVLEQHPMAWIVEVDCLLVDARMLPPELQDESAPARADPRPWSPRCRRMKRATELDSLIDEITVDAYNDEEQLAGFLVRADAALRHCERATLVGVEGEVLLTFGGSSELGLLVAAHRRWQGR